VGIAKVVQDETYRRLVELSEDAAKAHNASGTNAQKIGDFWAAAMDSTAQEKAAMTDLQPEFAKIAAARDLQELLTEVSNLHYIGASPMFSLYIFQDEKNSDRYALHLYQGGLGLPSRDYYFDNDERSRTIRSEYGPHVTRMFELLGDDSTRAKAEAATVVAIETDLARASRKLAALRDPQANYHAMTLAGVARLTPTIHWKEFLAAGHITGIDTVIVGQPEFFQQLEKSLRGRSLGRVEDLLPLAPGDRVRRAGGRTVRRRELPLLRHDHERNRRAACALEADARPGGELSRRRAGAALRAAVFLAAREGALREAHGRGVRGVPDPDPQPRLDEPGHQGAGAEEAGRGDEEGRLPRQVEGLLELPGQP
jgi:hypothetical protein